MRSFQRTSSLLTLTLLVSVSCGDPDLNTDLDSAGPPEVNIVLLTSEGAGVINPATFVDVGAATFCRDEAGARLNTLLCPGDVGARAATPVMDSVPMGWNIRIIFSELLDPDVEDLEDRDMSGSPEGHIDNTNPVALTCGGTTIAYDGFYDPSGNDVTTPGGPALLIQPSDFFPAATSTADCSVSINGTVVDKDGNAVSNPGPFGFGIAALHTIGISPADGEEMVDPAAVPVIAFNAPLDAASLDGILLEELDGNGDPVGPVLVTLAVSPDDPTTVAILPDDGVGNQILLKDSTAYRLTLASTTGIADALGGAAAVPADEVVGFTTGIFVPPDGGGGADAGADAGIDAMP